MSIKILLVEDNPDHVLLAKKILRNAGERYQVESAAKAQDGLDMMGKNDYDLILCDYRLPNLTALDILKKVRQDGQDLPFVVVTSAGSEKIAVELMKEGAYDYVVKDESYEETLPLVIQMAMERYNVKKEKEYAEEKLKKAYFELEKTDQELKDTTAQLIHSEKLSALGELSASVAHEMNQPLNVIKIICQSTFKDIENSKFDIEDIKKDFSEIINQTNKMGSIIDHMRLFSRRSEFGLKESVDMNTIITEVFKIFGQQLKDNNIRLIKDLEPNLPQTNGDSIRLEQVFLNLIINARNSIESCDSIDGVIQVRTFSSDSHKDIVFEVEDNGCGVSDNLKEKIFLPFFTTREPGKGTGLGLSLARKIIEEHKGMIELVGKNSQGAIFRVTLPIAAKGAIDG